MDHSAPLHMSGNANVRMNPIKIVDTIWMVNSIADFAAKSDNFCCCGFNMISFCVTFKSRSVVPWTVASFNKVVVKKYIARTPPKMYRKNKKRDKDNTAYCSFADDHQVNPTKEEQIQKTRINTKYRKTITENERIINRDIRYTDGLNVTYNFKMNVHKIDSMKHPLDIP